MEVAIGVGRTVVQDETRLALADSSHLLIQANLRPHFQTLGFALRQISFHRKRRLGQIQRRFIVGHNSSVFRQPCSGVLFIRSNALLQSIKRRKFLFITQLVPKLHCQALTV